MAALQRRTRSMLTRRRALPQYPESHRSGGPLQVRHRVSSIASSSANDTMLTKGTGRKRIRNFFLHPLVNVAEPLTDEGAQKFPLVTAAVRMLGC